MLENKNETISLQEAMGAEPRKSVNTIDMTKGITPEMVEQAKAEARVIGNTGDGIAVLDMSTMTTMDSYDILPKKEPEPIPFEDDIFAQLDMAVEKEKEKITERTEAVLEMQRKEFEEEMAIIEEKKLEEEDNFALGLASDSSYDTDSILGDDFNYLEEEAEFISTTRPVANKPSIENRVSINTDDDKSDEVNEKSEDSSQAKDIEEQDSRGPSILDLVDDESLFDEDEESTEEVVEDEEEDKRFEDLKTQVKEKITPIRKAIDFSKFTISQKAANAQKVMKLAVKDHQSIADWVLYSANRPISVTGLSGQEILKLNPENSGRNRLNTFRDMYRILYDHIYDGNKPEFEAWLKQIRFVDLPHIYFALYMATFNGSNFVTYTCDDPKCKNVFIKDIPFEDMVKYAKDETKEKVQAMLKLDTTSPSNDSYDVELFQVSDNYVFGFKTPSVWNIIIETASLSDQFLEKYADLIDMISYIDAIYLIDYENNTLIPVDTKPVPSDQAKTTARRIKVFYDIIKTLKSEDYYTIRAKITEFDKNTDDISYQIPGCTCPKCANKIDAMDMNPDNLIFMRHQLAAIGNM